MDLRRLVRHELRVRKLRVKAIEKPTPGMARITLTGDALRGFVTAAPDDHVKLLVPARGTDEPLLPVIEGGRLHWPERGARAIARDYTPVRFDPERQELDLEIVLHPGGHLASWVSQAEVGDVAGLAGPRGSHLIDAPLAGLLLVGDETALPAIRRWLRELPAEVRVLALIEVRNAGERQRLTTSAQARIEWLERGEAAPGTTNLLVNALARSTLPEPLTHAWLAGEANTVRLLRAHLETDRAFPAERISARGYWKRGVLDHQEPHRD